MDAVMDAVKHTGAHTQTRAIMHVLPHTVVTHTVMARTVSHTVAHVMPRTVTHTWVGMMPRVVTRTMIKRRGVITSTSRTPHPTVEWFLLRRTGPCSLHG